MVEKIKKVKKKKGYFSNEEMLNLFIKRNELKQIEDQTEEVLKQIDKVNEKIANNYIKLTWNLMHKPNFCNYDELTKQEMISDALFSCLKAGEKYDVQFKNPFAYFTQISWNAFIQGIKQMKRRTNVIVSVDHVENINFNEDCGEE